MQKSKSSFCQVICWSSVIKMEGGIIIMFEFPLVAENQTKETKKKAAQIRKKLKRMGQDRIVFPRNLIG